VKIFKISSSTCKHSCAFLKHSTITMAYTNSNETDWTLCCLCYSKKNEALMSVTEQGLLTLQRDLNDFIQLNALPTMISISRLDDGSGIASTLQSHGAMYHKSCRSSCNSYRVKRVRDSLENKTSEAAGRSPKKLRSSFGPLPDPNTLHCIICQGDDTNELRKASTEKINEHLKQWATTTKNWQLSSRLTARCDTHAMDAYYHVQCYLRLRDTARVVER